MKISFKYWIFLLSVSIVLSCSKKESKQGAMIPKQAVLAVVINGKSFCDKLPWTEVKAQNWLSELSNDSSLSAFTKSILNNPENSGIDIRNDMILYLIQDSLGGYGVLRGFLKDEKQFSTLANKLMENNSKVTDKEQLLYDKKSMCTWKDNQFAFAYDLPQMKNTSTYGNENSSNKEIVYSRNFSKIADGILKLEKSKTLAKDEHFTDLMKEQKDVNFWLNSEEMNKNNQAVGMLPVVDFAKLYKDARTAGTLLFDSGKMKLDIYSYSNKEMMEIWKKYRGTGINKSMLRRINSNNINFLLSANFKPEGIKEVIKLLGLEALGNMGVAMAGFTIDDFIAAISGDIQFSIADVTKDSIKPNMNFLFASGVNNKAAFNKLIEAGKKLSGNLKTTDVTYNYNGKYFAIGSKADAVNNFMTREGNEQPYMQKIGEGSIFLYANLEYAFSGMKTLYSANMDSIDMAIVDASKNMWDKMFINSGSFKNKGLYTQMEIKLKDTVTNSLKQLNNYSNLMYLLQKKKEERYSYKSIIY